MKKAKFRKGMKVKKIYHGVQGYTEETEGVITKVAKGVAYFEDESGVTFDAKTGRELENFFPPIWCELVPLKA